MMKRYSQSRRAFCSAIVEAKSSKFEIKRVYYIECLVSRILLDSDEVRMLFEPASKNVESFRGAIPVFF